MDIFTLICSEICNVCMKKAKNEQKEAEDGTIKNSALKHAS